MSKFGYPDKPVNNTKEDLFSVEVYIDGLCEFVKNCDTPMTISIQGDWGSGKTSMMNMVKDKLQGTIYPVWFNTWQFSQFDMGNTLVFSMMAVLLKELGCGGEHIKKVLSCFAGLAKNAAVAATDMTLGGFFSEKVNGILNPDATMDYANEIIELKAKFQEAVNQKIAKEQCDRVVVFVDDLDRLQPAKAIELLEVFKLFLDCENCVFILAVDYEVVTLGIKQKFGNDVSVEKGKSFFDKIIQLPFKMPVAQYNIRKYVLDALGRMGIDAGNTDTYISLIQASVGFNPRSMKRLFNTFQLLDIISRNRVSGITDMVRQKVLFAIICMQTKYEGLYRYFVSMPGSLEEDNISIFIGDNAAEKILEDEELVHIIMDDGTNPDLEVKKICGFMKLFVRAMQLDDDESISQEEIAVLEQVLKCSMVTSVSDAEEVSETDMEREYRWYNRQIAKRVNEMLSAYGKMEMWLPRKTRAGIKLSDVCCYQIYNSKYGFQFSVEYYLIREDANTIAVDILLRDKSKNATVFLDMLGENPLDILNVPAKKNSWGGYDYEYVARFNIEDNELAGKIAELWVKSREEMMNKYVK